MSSSVSEDILKGMHIFLYIDQELGICSCNYHIFISDSESSHPTQVQLKQIWKIKGKDNPL